MAPPPPPESQATGWLWWVPRLSFALFISAVVALLWLSNRADNEEQRASLISDMLWLEQNLRFVTTHNEELLGQIGKREARNQTSFEAYARVLIDNQTGLRRVRWLDAAGDRQLAYPAGGAPESDAALGVLARSLGKPVYGPAYAIDGNDWRFEVYVPVFQDGRPAGLVAGAYSLQRMIEESVPWWLAERYRIVVADADGRILASRSKVEAPISEGGYQLAFDPPGRGLSLQALPYRLPVPLAGKLLSAALVFLALVVLWSLWALRRHERRRLAAEQALRDEHAFRKAMEDSVQTGLRARDLDGRITYVNPAFCAMVGWNAEELVGRAPPMPYWVDAEIEATRALHDRILAGVGPERGFEVSFKRRGGEVFPVLIHEAPLIDAHGKQTGWMSSVVDVSHQKQADELVLQQRERLQATARLVAMGEMASSLAHELNQPLAAIASYNAGCLNQIKSGRADNGELEQVLTKSMAQAQRAGRIIRRIYDFVRRAEPKSAPCAIGLLVGEIIDLLEPDARRQGVRLVKEIPEDLPVVEGDQILLGQAILNLMRNGIEAMRETAPDQRILKVSARLEDDQAHISVADRGSGIPAEAMTRLFEPLFTTKAEGMGMGLNICRSVVEGHHGRLWVDTATGDGGGSIFHISLPIKRR